MFIKNNDETPWLGSKPVCLAHVAQCLLAVWLVFPVVCLVTSYVWTLNQGGVAAAVLLQDSGNLIPGHGGLLDRFDSYIFSGALGYFYITALLPRLGLA